MEACWFARIPWRAAGTPPGRRFGIRMKEWVKKEDILNLNLWEGDKIFLRLLKENAPFFSLKLTYEGDRLTEAVLDGENLQNSL